MPTLLRLIDGILWRGLECIVGGGRGYFIGSDDGGGSDDDGRWMVGSSFQNIVDNVDASVFCTRHDDEAVIETKEVTTTNWSLERVEEDWLIA